ncbi:hypothetical protein C8035_v012375 [Colletotrichum spinosum]|uniref:Uncharacterized protein n=1 Tax=Colletotrichum spinosum TaxID=1347390 RepID=A0A4R8Q6F5_9PEZI|nr:hypothetical protein C8035_v012375 [Colletotrichum spinosum]
MSGNPAEINFSEPSQSVITDILHTSFNWFRGQPWTDGANPGHPYEHPNFGPHLRRLGYAPGDPTLVSQADIMTYTTHWDDQLNEAYLEAQTFMKSADPRLFTQGINSFSPDQLKDVVNASWSHVCATNFLKPDAVNHPLLSKESLGSFFGAESRLADVRDSDVRQFLKHYNSSFEQLDDPPPAGGFPDSGFWPSPTSHSDNSRTEFLMPFLNQTDLCNPSILRALALNRFTNPPRAFSRADWEGSHLARASKRCVPYYCDNCFLGFPTTDLVRRSRALRTNSTEFAKHSIVFSAPSGEETKAELFESLRAKGILFDWGEGIMVLIIQTAILRFLINVARRIQDQLQALGPERTRFTGPVISWTSIPTDYLTFDEKSTGLLFTDQFFPFFTESSRWCDRFDKMLDSRLESARQHLKNLWHDPFYFRNQIRFQFNQHYGRVSAAQSGGQRFVQTPAAISSQLAGLDLQSGSAVTEGILPHIIETDIDAKKALANDLIRRVIRWALFQVEAYQVLKTKLIRLRDVERRSTNVDLNAKDRSLRLKGEALEAWVDLGHHARAVADIHIEHLIANGGVIAAGEFRPSFRRDTTWQDLKAQAPRNEWLLPRHVGQDNRILFTQTSGFDSEDGPQDSRGAIRAGFESEYTISCLSLPKLLQSLCSSLKEDAVGLGTMAQADYDTILWAGLLSQRMESLQPFDGYLANATTREALGRRSSALLFMSFYADFPFENFVKHDDLRLVHWFLGITYNPHSTETHERDPSLVHQWLAGFWEVINDALGRKNGFAPSNEMCVDPPRHHQEPDGVPRRPKTRLVRPYRVSKSGTRDIRPQRVLRYLGEVKTQHPQSFKEPKFTVDRFLGRITTIAPACYREPGGGSSNTASHNAITMRLAETEAQEQADADADLEAFTKRLNSGDRSNVIPRAQWKTAEFLYKKAPGTIRWCDFKRFLVALGFRIVSGQTGSLVHVYPDRCPFPYQPGEFARLTFHRKHREPEELNDPERRNYRELLEYHFGLTWENLQKYYR